MQQGQQQLSVEQLIPLLETEKRWKETNFYRKMLSQDNTECVSGLLYNLNEIIHGKQYPPMARLGATRLLKACLEAGQEYFNFAVQEGDLLDKLVGYAKIKPNTNIFSSKPDKKEVQISVTLFTYIVEGFLFWGQWFPETKFETLFKQLKQAGIQIPDVQKVQIFKADQWNLYVNGQFQKKEGAVDDALHQKQSQQAKKQETPTQGRQEDDDHINQSIQEKILEQDSVKSLMVEMLQNMDKRGDELNMIAESFNNLQTFYNQALRSNARIRQNLLEQMQDKGQECVQILQVLDSFFSQQISFDEMKQTLLSLADHENQNNERQNQQQDQRSSDQRRQEEQKRIEMENEAKRKYQEQEEQLKRERDAENQRKNQMEQQKQREIEEQQRKQKVLEEQKKLEEQNRQKQLQEELFRKQKEEDKKRQIEEQERQKHIEQVELQRKREQDSKRKPDNQRPQNSSLNNQGAEEDEEEGKNDWFQASKYHKNHQGAEEINEIQMGFIQDNQQQGNNLNSKFNQENSQQPMSLPFGQSQKNPFQSQQKMQIISPTQQPDNYYQQSREQSNLNFSNQNQQQMNRLNDQNSRIPSNPKFVVSEIQSSNHMNNLANHSSKEHGQLGFQPLQFEQKSALKSQINTNQLKTSNLNHSQSSNRFASVIYNNELWESKSQIRKEEKSVLQQSLMESKRVPVYSKDKQLTNELSNLKIQINEIRRERDVEVNKLHLENEQLKRQIQELNASKQNRNEEHHDQALGAQERIELEKKLYERDEMLNKQHQKEEKLSREMSQLKEIISQYDQQKMESYQIIQGKKMAMEQENQKTKQQLSDFIENNQKEFNNRFEEMQRKLHDKEQEAATYHNQLQLSEIENQSLKNELRLQPNSDNRHDNTQAVREKEMKIIDLRNQIEVLANQISGIDEQTKGKNNEILALKKNVSELKDQLGFSESQVSLVRENNVQKEIQLHALKQEIFDFQQKFQSKDFAFKNLESSIQRKSDILSDFKKSSELQVNKFKEQLEEREGEIRLLQRQKHDLEEKLDNIVFQNREDLNRIVAASKISEEEKQVYQKTVQENEFLKKERIEAYEREQNLQAQISQMGSAWNNLQKEYELQESNLEDILATNNLITKKLYERDEYYSKLQDEKQKQYDQIEKKSLQELKLSRQAVENIKAEKSKKEIELEREADTLRKENQLLLSNLQSKALFMSEKLSFLPNAILSPKRNEEEVNLFEGHQQEQGISAMAQKGSQKFMSPKRDINRLENDFTSLKSSPNSHYRIEVNADNLQKSMGALPKNFLGREVTFNPAYFSYLKGDKGQMYRFKKACLKSKIALYQDSFLNVGIISETKEIEDKFYLMMTLFFENKSLNQELTGFEVSYDGDQSINVYKKPTTLPSLFKQSCQHQQQILTEFNEMPYKVIQCTVKYWVNSSQTSIQFPLPNSVNKFFQERPEATQYTITEAFSKYAHLLNCSEEIKVDRNVASSQYDYTGFFPSFVTLPASEQLFDFSCIAGQYFMKSINTNFWLKVFFNKKENKALFQIVYDNQQQSYSLETMKYILQTLVHIFKE